MYVITDACVSCGTCADAAVPVVLGRDHGIKCGKEEIKCEESYRC